MSTTAYRVTLRARLATSNEVFHVDVGDPIWRAPQPVHIPRLLSGEIHLLGYPIPKVLAEKGVTAIQRGSASTRWRDFGDIYLLTGTHPLTAGAVRAAIVSVARHRKAELQPLAPLLDDYAEWGQSRYMAWRNRQRLQDRLPDQFADLLEATFRFADPLLDGADVGDDIRWDPVTQRWGGDA